MERKNPFRLIDPAPLPPSGDRPLEVGVIRGGAVESRHRVHALVCDSRGAEVHRWGNPGLVFFPRSSVKLLQAIPWVTAHFDKRWELKQEELAIACGSHKGEDYHVKVVSRWLDRLGLSEDSLECGVHAPYHQASAHALIRAGKQPTQLHNNCSGKHAGILTECCGMGWETHGYTNYDHPAQARIREVMGAFLGLDLCHAPWGIDGCGIPTYAVTLQSLALAMARVADPQGLEPELGEAARALTRAIAAESRLIGGTDSFCSQVVPQTEGRVFAKVGAEGVYGAWIPGSGLGIAIKSEDGGSRAAEVAMAAVLRELGHPLSFFSPLVRRWTGEVVGQLICG